MLQVQRYNKRCGSCYHIGWWRFLWCHRWCISLRRNRGRRLAESFICSHSSCRRQSRRGICVWHGRDTQESARCFLNPGWFYMYVRNIRMEEISRKHQSHHLRNTVESSTFLQNRTLVLCWIFCFLSVTLLRSYSCKVWTQKPLGQF